MEFSIHGLSPGIGIEKKGLYSKFLCLNWEINFKYATTS